MRPGVMVGSSVWVVSRRRARLVVWCSVCVASAGYLRCACCCGCVDGGGLFACLPVELVPAFGGCLCARMSAVVCGGGGGGRCARRLVGVVGCGCACGRVLGVGCRGVCGRRVQSGFLGPYVSFKPMRPAYEHQQAHHVVYEKEFYAYFKLYCFLQP